MHTDWHPIMHIMSVRGWHVPTECEYDTRYDSPPIALDGRAPRGSPGGDVPLVGAVEAGFELAVDQAFFGRLAL